MAYTSLCIYDFVEWSNFNPLDISQWITFPTLSSLLSLLLLFFFLLLLLLLSLLFRVFHVSILLLLLLLFYPLQVFHTTSEW